MRRLMAAVLGLVALTLLVTEAAMRPSASERFVLGGVYLAAAVATVGLFVWVRRMSRRFRSVSASLQTVALGSVAVAALAVLLASQTMFISPHDRNLVLVALALGVALGSALAVAIGSSVTSDLAAVRQATERLAEGDKEARAGIDRRDEVGELSVAFDQMAAALEASDSERRTLLASIGHDLRTPLASLRALIEGMEDGVVSDTDAALGAMAKDVEHLARLVDDVFLFARTEAGTLELHTEDVDLAELVDEAVEVIRPVAGRRNITVVASAAGPIRTQADPWAMGRVLRNLLDNAVRHAPTGGHVTVVTESSGGRPVVRVEDDGPGFDPAVRSVAFQRFTRGDESRHPDQGGAGLGLAIAHGIVQAHGGVITIGDGPGGRVVVTL